MNHTSSQRLIISSLSVACMMLASTFSPVSVLAQSAIAQPPAVRQAKEVAINDSSITAIPPRLDVSVKPGDVVQKTLKVRNESKEVQYLKSSLEDFIVDRDGKTPLPVTDTVSDRFSLAKWLTVSPSSYSIKPGETVVIDLVIQVPQDALPGGHYAMVLYEPAGGGTLEGGTSTAAGLSAISQKVGTLLYITVAGDIHEEAFVRDLRVPPFAEFGPVSVNYKIENRSDTHIRPQTSIEVRDIFGRVIDTVKADEKNIFPFTAREFNASTTRYWGLGKYTVRVVAPYGEHGKVAYANASFWMVPYKLIIGIGILLSSLVAMYIVIRRHLLHRNDYRNQEIEMLREKIENIEKEKLEQ